MNKKEYIILLLLTFLVTEGCAQTSENLRPAFGGFGDVNLNMARANFSQLPGVPDCNALYKSGIGFGPAFGIFYELPLQNKFSLLLRGVYNLYGEKLTSNEQTPIAINGAAAQATIEHSIKATLGMIGFQPLASYHITPAFSAHLGGEIGYVIQSSFNQIETLTQPSSTGVFSNGLRTRNAQSGKIPDANKFATSLLGGVSYALPLNKSNSLYAVPELYYSFGITPIVKNISWSVNQLRGGIAILYEILEAPPEPPKPRDTIVIPPAPIAFISASGVEKNGEEKPVVTMHVEEILSSKMTPLLPYVFFKATELKIPDRYRLIDSMQASAFYELSLKQSDVMEINHQTLNIIGRRLLENPDARITLAGITLNKSRNSIAKNLALSRGNVVAEYLESVWHIAPERIRIFTHPLAESVASALDTDGIAEANRVEIASNAFDILQPVLASDTVSSVTPPTLRFHPSVKYSDQIPKWKIQISQNGTGLKTFEGSGIPPASLDWIVGDDEKTVPHYPGHIDYAFRVTGSHSDEGLAEGSIAVERISLQKKKVQRIADREIEKYNLLLFDLQSSEISENNRQIIELIQKHLKDISRITIIGHTDRTGESESNRRLSLERAQKTAKALGVTNAEIRGIANESDSYDNSFPEGRCLSRTVDIIIETPTTVE